VNSWKVILAAVVIFGAGVLTGGLLVNYVNHSPLQNVRLPFVGARLHSQMGGHGQARPEEFPRPRSPEMLRKEFVERFDNALKLTPAQHDAIQKIITEGQEQNRQIWTNVAPKMRQTLEEVQQRIRAELTPDQQKQFEALIKRLAPHRPPRDKAPPGFSPPTNLPPPAPGL
jgi:DNA-binding PucR family transcriptional regulator